MEKNQDNNNDQKKIEFGTKAKWSKIKWRTFK